MKIIWNWKGRSPSWQMICDIWLWCFHYCLTREGWFPYYHGLTPDLHRIRNWSCFRGTFTVGRKWRLLWELYLPLVLFGGMMQTSASHHMQISCWSTRTFSYLNVWLYSNVIEADFPEDFRDYIDCLRHTSWVWVSVDHPSLIPLYTVPC